MVLMTLMREALNAKMSDLATATLKIKLMPRSAMASLIFFFRRSFMEVLDPSNLTGECNDFELRVP